jgi:hypothetical protein
MLDFIDFRIVKALVLIGSTLFGWANPEMIAEAVITATSTLGLAEIGQSRKDKKAQ